MVTRALEKSERSLVLRKWGGVRKAKIIEEERGKKKEREEEEEEAEGGKGRALRENNGDDNVFTAFIIIITYWALHEARL